MIKAENNGENQHSFPGTEKLVVQVVVAVVVVALVIVVVVVLAYDCFLIALLTFVKAAVRQDVLCSNACNTVYLIGALQHRR